MTAVATESLTAEQMVKIAREHVDAFGSGDWERLQAGLTARTPVTTSWEPSAWCEGPEKIVELFRGWKKAFPDAAGTVTSAVASGDTAALELTWKGTQTGPLVTAEGDRSRRRAGARRLPVPSSSRSRAARSRRAASTSTR